MTHRSRSAAWDCLLLACAAWASGCGASGTSPSEPPAVALEKVDWRKVESEPRRLDEIATVGFRSRGKSTGFNPPEISLGSPDEHSEADNSGKPESANPAWQAFDADTTAADAGEQSTTAAPSEPAVLAEQQPAAGPVDPFPQTPLPWARRTSPRTPEFEAVVRRADAAVQHGFRLAERGAAFSARNQFVEAIGLLAGALDLENQTQVFSQSLHAGRAALVEARDFSNRNAKSSLDLARVIAAHRTPVLKSEPLGSLSPIVAQRRYYTFAQEQLALAAGEEPAGSLALYGLGKTASQARGRQTADSLSLAAEQATCYQAALLVDADNFRAASELGVVLAEMGRNEAARELFLRSLAISPQAATWQNLSVVHTRLGETMLAEQALAKSQQLRKTRLGEITGDNLRWVDPETFARSLPAGEAPAIATRPVEPKSSTVGPPVTVKKRTAMRLPWNRNPKR